MKELSVSWENKQLTFIGRDVERIPFTLVKMYGNRAKLLDLSFNQLTSLRELEGFSSLEDLILDNNCLTDSIEFPFCPSLTTLSMNKNKFESLENLIIRISKSYPNLHYLSLLGNPCCPDQLTTQDASEHDYSKYRLMVLYKFPKLKFLDSNVVRKSEKIEAIKKGPYMRTVRPDEGMFQVISEPESTQTWQYSPLPLPNYSWPVAPKGAYGRLRYKYTGKHSEGNRFIRNSHL